MGARPTDDESVLGYIAHLTRTKSLTEVKVTRDGWTNNYQGTKLDYIAIGV